MHVNYRETDLGRNMHTYTTPSKDYGSLIRVAIKGSTGWNVGLAPFKTSFKFIIQSLSIRNKLMARHGGSRL